MQGILSGMAQHMVLYRLHTTNFVS